jgi:uncharacterized membrane protein
VFAIFMTLLALDVRLPDGADLHTSWGIIDALEATAGNFQAYALSFIVIAMMWNTHLRRYRYLTAVDGEIIAGTIFQLLLTGLIPFATSMIAQSTAPLVIAVYAGIITLNILVGWATWRIAIADPRRVTSQFTSAARREGDWRSACPAIFAVSIQIAFRAPVATMCFWALQIPANMVIRRWVARSAHP